MGFAADQRQSHGIRNNQGNILHDKNIIRNILENHTIVITFCVLILSNEAIPQLIPTEQLPVHMTHRTKYNTTYSYDNMQSVAAS